MKIFLTIGNSPEQAFDAKIIRIGRDAACQIHFNNREFPMVSRRHAELRWTGGGWIVTDSNSSYGTFLGGQKITAPQLIAADDQIQIGRQGPLIRVVRIENETQTETSPENSARAKTDFPPAPMPSAPLFPPSRKTDFQTVPPPKSGVFSLDLVSGEIVTQTPFRIVKNSVWLGRDKNCDVVFSPQNVIVSRRHAEIKRDKNRFFISDNRSFNGTLVNERRISAPTPIYHFDTIRLGVGGPLLRFDAPDLPAPNNADFSGQRGAANRQAEISSAANHPVGSQTIVFRKDLALEQNGEPELIMSVAFGEKSELFIGRAAANDIQLDGLQISNRHARLFRTGNEIFIEDRNSTNGVYVNGERVSRIRLRTEDAAQIGAFALRLDESGKINVFDTRAKTGIDAIKITKEVTNPAVGGKNSPARRYFNFD